MGDLDQATLESIRREVHAALSKLPPEDAETLRARFSIDSASRVAKEEESTLRAVAREIAKLKARK